MPRHDGILLLDKPIGPTSHDLVAAVRRIAQLREVGHAGTLDPMARGVLVVLLGEATKLSPYLTAESKEYRATVVFGRSTDSDDATGTTLEAQPLPPDWLSMTALDQALECERARTSQNPPAVSALKYGGVRAHRLHRRGEAVPIRPRTVRVESLEVEAWSADSVTLLTRVSTGYYVRALARDLGCFLGVPAHLGALTRLRSGQFSLDECFPFPLGEPFRPERHLIPAAHAAARCLPGLCLTDEGVRRATQGQSLGLEHVQDPAALPALVAGEDGGGPTMAWFDGQARLVALGRRVSDAELRVTRGFRLA